MKDNIKELKALVRFLDANAYKIGYCMANEKCRVGLEVAQSHVEKLDIYTEYAERIKELIKIVDLAVDYIAKDIRKEDIRGELSSIESAKRYMNFDSYLNIKNIQESIEYEL